MDAVDAAMFTAHASQGPNTFYWDEGNVDASSSDPANVEVGGADFSILKANYGYNGGINSVVEFMFGFTGRMYDDETGLQNNLNRWYDAKVGRWISEDPIGFEAGDANIYRYVGNGPTNATDPTGLFSVSNWWNEYKVRVIPFGKQPPPVDGFDNACQIGADVGTVTAIVAGTAACGVAAAGADVVLVEAGSLPGIGTRFCKPLKVDPKKLLEDRYFRKLKDAWRHDNFRNRP